MSALGDLIRRPLVTEKNNALSAQNVYVFEVALKATKPLIKKSVERGFGVKVQKVRTLVGRRDGKRTAQGRGRVRYFKKALVQLKPGERIAVFEGGG